jgi:FkbM family methyltransferase
VTFDFKGVSIKACYFEGHDQSCRLHLNEPVFKNKYWNIKKGDVVLDVGACHGEYTLPALGLGAEKVIAWTPEEYAPRLRDNLQANDWENRCIILEKGLWNKKGFLRSNYPHMPVFSETCPEQSREEIAKYFNPENLFYFEVETLDSSIAMQEKHIEWIKIDVEGAELEVLQGGEALLKKYQPTLLIENHLFKDTEIPERIRNFVIGLNVGYKEIVTGLFDDEIYHESTSHSVYEVK